jgi:acyl-CoA synthetase (AMP-forming)/AMP-acid ligase II/thioesterase domain-containing protein/acyl carrier protein
MGPTLNSTISLPQRRELSFPCRTVAEAIKRHASGAPDARALVIPNRPSLTYSGLQRQIEGIATNLQTAGIGAGQRIGIVLPDGPELAIAITATACHATAVPFNPNLTTAEFDDLIATLKLDAVVVPDWADTAARDVAGRHRLSLLEAVRPDHSIGIRLRTERALSSARDHVIGPDDAAFILRTSGTTARPKLVSVTHRNLLAMAERLLHWFALTPRDRALSVMPLYYAQGLKTALFVPLILGGSLACPSRTNGTDFFSWLAELAPTWYSAGPTFHRTVEERARSRGASGFRHTLRFIQSASAPLPEAVREGLETSFGVPVLDSYGLSEAGLVAANSTVPQCQKPGTVGRPWRDELAIIGDDGQWLAPDVLGEIVVRGPGVTPGYADDPDATRAAFRDGWFHTGDLGRLDDDGFLTVVGRLKDLINRGGEKIAPAEIDHALMRHPAVLEAVTFSVPHPRLGEDVAAAVVLRPGYSATSLELRQFLRTTLATFKIPRRIHRAAQLPKGETGKVSRQDVARLFSAVRVTRAPVEWRSPLEVEIAELWQRLLERTDIGCDDDFFELGGDSLLALQMLVELERLSGKRLPDTILFEAATIRQLGESIKETPATTDHHLLVQLQGGADRTPFFFVDGDFWGSGYYARKIARSLGSEQPFFDLRAPVILRSYDLANDVPSIEQMARNYIPLITAVQPHGPYRLIGYCNGALVALDLARQLATAGECVELVAMVDPISLNARPSLRRVLRILDKMLTLVGCDTRRRESQIGTAMSLIWRAVRKAERLLRRKPKTDDGNGHEYVRTAVQLNREQGLASREKRLTHAYLRAMARYIPSPVSANVICLIAEAHCRYTTYAGHVWRKFAPNLDVIVVPGDHVSCVTRHANVLATHLRAFLADRGLDRA